MSKKLIAYVASPVGGLYAINPKNAKTLIVARATQYCKFVKNAGMIPLSTPINFIDVYDEMTEREEALRDCIEILKKCDVFVYSKIDSYGSAGIRLELEVAKELGLKIVEINSLTE